MQELSGIRAQTFQVLDPKGKYVAILWGEDRLNIVANNHGMLSFTLQQHKVLVDPSNSQVGVFGEIGVL